MSLPFAARGQIRVCHVTATINTVEKLYNFFRHISPEDYGLIEIIFQNPDDRLVPIVEAYKDKISIQYLRTPRGLSISRNQGIQKAQGEYITIPEDDCYPGPRFAQKVVQFLDAHPQIDILVVRWRNSDLQGTEPYTHYATGWLSKEEVFGLFSIGLVFRRNVFERIGLFDEHLGLGSPSIFQGGRL